MPLSTFLDGDTPTQLRGLAWLSLSDVGHVVTRTVVSDGGGGGTISWAAGTAVPCRIDPIGDRGSPRSTGGRIDERSTHVVTVSSGTIPGTALVADSRFAIDGRGTFEVTAVRDRTAEWSRQVEVVAT
jgi:hypothetical protein